MKAGHEDARSAPVQEEHQRRARWPASSKREFGRRAFSSSTGHLHIVGIEITVAHDADFFNRVERWPHHFEQR